MGADYAMRMADAVVLGLWLARPHTNSRGMVHGGLLAALADNAMGLSCGVKIDGGRTRLVTVSLGIDFVGTAKTGQWLTIESDVVKTGKTLCFAQCLAKADGEIVARGNGTFRVITPPD